MAIMSEMGACPSASPAGNGERTPTRRIRARCCARASSGQATAVPPRNVMNSRAAYPLPSSGDTALYRRLPVSNETGHNAEGAARAAALHG